MGVTYKNLSNGREVTRPHEDEWLEASAGWERVEPAIKPLKKDDKEGSKD